MRREARERGGGKTTHKANMDKRKKKKKTKIQKATRTYSYARERFCVTRCCRPSPQTLNHQSTEYCVKKRGPEKRAFPTQNFGRPPLLPPPKGFYRGFHCSIKSGLYARTRRKLETLNAKLIMEESKNQCAVPVASSSSILPR